MGRTLDLDFVDQIRKRAGSGENQNQDDNDARERLTAHAIKLQPPSVKIR